MVAGVLGGPPQELIPVQLVLGKLFRRRAIAVAGDTVAVFVRGARRWRVEFCGSARASFGPRSLTSPFLRIDGTVYPVSGRHLGAVNRVYVAAGGVDVSPLERRVAAARVELWAGCDAMFVGWHSKDPPTNPGLPGSDLGLAVDAARFLDTAPWLPHPRVDPGAVEVLVGGDEVRLYRRGELVVSAVARGAFVAQLDRGRVVVAGVELWVTESELVAARQVLRVAAGMAG